MPHASWLCGNYSSGLKRMRCEAFWRALHNPKHVTFEDIGLIFFDQDRTGRYTSRGDHEYSEHDMGMPWLQHKYNKEKNMVKRKVNNGNEKWKWKMHLVIQVFRNWKCDLLNLRRKDHRVKLRPCHPQIPNSSVWAWCVLPAGGTAGATQSHCNGADLVVGPGRAHQVLQPGGLDLPVPQLVVS